MSGCLSRAEVVYLRDDRTSVSVFGNRDHNIIKVALEQHPVNRMAMALLIAQAMALQVVIHPQVLQAWFGRKMSEFIGALPLDQREPFVLRLLMDRFKDMPRAS